MTQFLEVPIIDLTRKVRLSSNNKLSKRNKAENNVCLPKAAAVVLICAIVLMVIFLISSGGAFGGLSDGGSVSSGEISEGNSGSSNASAGDIGASANSADDGETGEGDGVFSSAWNYIKTLFSGGAGSGSSENNEEMTENINVISAMEAAALPDLALIEEEREAAKEAARIAAEEEAARLEEERLAAEREEKIRKTGIAVEDLEAEKEKILNMDPYSVTAADLRQRFADTAFVGDSVASGVSYYDWLPESQAFCVKGAVVTYADGSFASAISLSPSYIFSAYGLNDLVAYGSNVDFFIENYTAKINMVREALPDTKVYVNAIFPGSPSATANHSYYQYLDSYNAGLEKMCEDFGENVYYIDCGFIIEDLNLFGGDGQHMQKIGYVYWLTYLADIAGLPEAE